MYQLNPLMEANAKELISDKTLSWVNDPSGIKRRNRAAQLAVDRGGTSWLHPLKNKKLVAAAKKDLEDVDYDLSRLENN